MDMISGSGTVADIGCDHGRFSCALIQQGLATRCIAIDISEPSLEKANRLAGFVGVSDRVETRLGNGFEPLAVGEADAVAILGMGGTLMARLLDACEMPLQGAKKAIFQPMRAAADIREYLFLHGYPILDDRVVEEGGRLYQVFCAEAPTGNGTGIPLPEGWPADCFLLGYQAFANRDPLTRTLAQRMLNGYEKNLKTASTPKLIRQAEQMRQILQNWEEPPCS